MTDNNQTKACACEPTCTCPPGECRCARGPSCNCGNDCRCSPASCGCAA